MFVYVVTKTSHHAWNISNETTSEVVAVFSDMAVASTYCEQNTRHGVTDFDFEEFEVDTQ